MGNVRSATSEDSMENERLEALIDELKTIRDRELEILIEIEEIIRNCPAVQSPSAGHPKNLCSHSQQHQCFSETPEFWHSLLFVWENRE
jgi:hypothetical protein